MSQNKTQRALLAILLTGLLTAAALPQPGGADETPSGHWEHLGEDGAVWVPAERPAATQLPSADLGAYHNHTETEVVLLDLAAARPDVFTLHSIGTSVEGRPIWMLRVTGPGDDSLRPRVLFDGAHHGNEVIGSETLIRFLLDIDERYDTNDTVRSVLEHVVLDVVPMVNVDSVHRIPQCDHYAKCRKNSNGVDLNRNYPDHWGGGGSSGDPGSATYRGPEPLSEPETQAISALLDMNDYALHASFHSGTELILWPYGWTSAAPPEEALYKTLGDELTALTGVPHGQTARVLYQATGTTMDQAAGSAAGWRPISFSPEAYVGSGNAFDWWRLFNPAEAESAIAPVVARWAPLLWHLAQEAPAFAPAHLEAPGSLDVGPDAATLSAAVSPASRRPLLDASLWFDPQEAPVAVDPADPVDLVDGPGTQNVSFSLLAERGGNHTGGLHLDAGPAGERTYEVGLTLVQVGLELGLARTVMGSPHQNVANVTVTTGPFDRVVGDLTLRLEPSGETFASVPFSATEGGPATASFTFDAEGLSRGTHHAIATATFTAFDGSDARPGVARVAASFDVVRPEVVLEKRFAEEGAVLEPVDVLSIYRNTGDLPAEDLVVEEMVPPGYVYWFRDGPLPLPADPLGSPPPDDVALLPDGAVRLTWMVGTLEPGKGLGIRYGLLPLVPGETTLDSEWTYRADFGDAEVIYKEKAQPGHTTR